MHFEFGFYSSLLLIFFVHGMVYAILSFRKSVIKESAPDFWLGCFLVLCCLYIAPWMLGFGGWYDNQPYRDILFYVPMQQLFFMGPVLFFYVQSLLNPSFRLNRKRFLQLIPGILYILFSIVMFVTDKLILKSYYFLADGADRDFDSWYQYTGLISMLFYFFLSLRYYRLYRRLMLQVISYADLVLFKYVRNFLLAFLIMLLIKVVFFFLDLLGVFSNLAYIGPWWEYFSFALVFYYIAISGYSNSVTTRIPYSLKLIGNHPALLLNAGQTETEEPAEIQEAELIDITETRIEDTREQELVQAWKPKLLALLTEQKIYEDPELTLSQVSKMLGTNVNVLSRVVNRGFDQNFNDLVNQYRIEAVKFQLAAGKQKEQTLLGIAFDCGFNSKATFNRAFKKALGCSPKTYLENNPL